MDTYKFFPVNILRAPAFSYADYSTKKLKQILKDTYFQKSVLIASPVFYEQLQKVGFEYAALDTKAIHTLLKYFNRISFRPTPFGLFATFIPVYWSDEDKIVIGNGRVHIKKSFTHELSQVQALKKTLNHHQLQYSLNQSIYKSGNELRYLTSLLNYTDKKHDFSIQSITHNKHLDAFFNYCTQKRPRHELVNFLTGQQVCDFTEADMLVNELIEIEALVDDVQPNITGPDYLERILTAFNATGASVKPYETLAIANGRLNKKQNTALGTILTKPDDCYINLEGVNQHATIDNKHKASILKAINCVATLNPIAPENSYLKDFKADFFKKFEGQVLPLLYVLDPEVGIGYQNLTESSETNQLLEGIEWKYHNKQDAALTWTAAHRLLFNKWNGTNVHQPIITLTETDLHSLNNNHKTSFSPQSISVMFRLYNDKVFIESAGGVSATSLIGRFTPFNETIKLLADDIVKNEVLSNPEVIFAEVVHVCEFHAANINRRDNIYPYEIPVLTQSVIDSEYQIPLSDIWVSVTNGEIILQSAKHNKRIIPRLSSAFNYSRNNLAVFRFLCDLQLPHTYNMQLNLSTFFPGLKYYPRVEYLNTILCLATWHITKDELSHIINAKDSARLMLFKKLRQRIKLPKWIVITTHDHQLTFNLDKPTEVDFLLQTIKNHDNVTIKEFLFTRTSPVTNGRKPLTNQFITSLYHQNEVYKKTSLPVINESETLRKLMPGDEWLYFKLYCNPTRADELLTGCIYNLTTLLQKKGVICQWFYIRYMDPDYHLRLRFKVVKGHFKKAMAIITQHINQNVRQEKIAHYDITIYNRELERYGHENIELVEEVFFKSSELMLYYLHNAPTDNYSPQYVAFLDIRAILNCFAIYGNERITIISAVVNGFFTEFDDHKNLKYQLDLKYRSMEKQLTALVANQNQNLASRNTGAAYNGLLQALNNLYLKVKHQPPAQVYKWVTAIIHMHLNRLFIDDSRKQELVIYYLLLKYEKMQLAIMAKQVSSV